MSTWSEWRPGSGLRQPGPEAIICLWAGRRLRDVAGLDRSTIATGLLIASGGMGVGFLSRGLPTDRLTRLGLRPMTIAGSGMGLFTIILVVLATGWITGPGLANPSDASEALNK